MDFLITALAAFVPSLVFLLYCIFTGINRQRANDRPKTRSKPKSIFKPKKSKKPKSSESIFTLPDYSRYSMTWKEWLKYYCMAAGLGIVTGYLFFRSTLVCTLLCLAVIPYPWIKKKDLIKKRKAELNLQFKDALYSISSSLSAGHTIESAFQCAPEDLKLLYPDENTLIIREINYINRKLEMNETIENALYDFALRSQVEDIRSFVEVLNTSKRSGANLMDVVRNTAGILQDKIEIKQEIETLLSQRKFEQKVLNVIPLAMMLLLNGSSPDYLSPVYTTIQGRVAMIVVSLLLLAAYFIGKKIVSIEV